MKLRPLTPPAPPGPTIGDLVAPTARLLLPKGAPEEEWHAVRRTGLGGSDIAAVLGMDGRWSSAMRVYEEKHGRGDYTDSTAAYVGRMLEPVIAAIFSDLSGLPIIEPPGTLQHANHPWMIANLDYLAVEENDQVVPVECKNRNWRVASQWEHETPDDVAVQAVWQIAVGGYSHAYTVALLGGNQPRWYRIERDEELIEHLIQWCGAWWERHIEMGIRPDADGSQATTELLAHLWDAVPESKVEVDPLVTAGLLEEEERLQAGIRALNTKLDRVHNRLCAQLGDAEIATIGGRPVYTWKQNSTFRAKDFQAEQPELASQYTRPVEHIDTDRLAADHPEIFRQYRARRLYLPPKGTTA